MKRSLAASALAAGSVLAVSACGGHATARTDWGGFPSWLPSTAPVHQVVQASASHPAYASQGDTVDLHLPSGEVLVTAVGPATPGQGLTPQPATTSCTFTLTVRGVRGAVPLAPEEFSTTDQVGAVRALAATQGEPAPPTTITPGVTSSFQARTIMRAGEGLLRWEPGGQLAPVAWDFTVEVD